MRRHAQQQLPTQVLRPLWVWPRQITSEAFTFVSPLTGAKGNGSVPIILDDYEVTHGTCGAQQVVVLNFGF
jgi:hypothetical protein